MSKKTTVILPKGYSQFRRVMRDESGNALTDESGAERVLTFSPGQMVELSHEELEAVRDHIGNPLQLAKVDDKAEALGKPDGKATRKFQEETRELREKQRAERLKAKEEAATGDKVTTKRAAPPAATTHKADIEKK